MKLVCFDDEGWLYSENEIAIMQRIFARHWRIVRRPNKFSAKITEVVLVRGPNCPTNGCRRG